MRRAVFLILFLLTILPLTTAQAQETVVIDTMQIDLWPEYDRTDVLVIYRFTLSDATSLPAALTMRIPASSGGPYNVAFRDINESGEVNLLNLDYTTIEEGGWILVSFTAPTADLQLEFYDPGLAIEGEQRTYEFVWAGDYTVRSMAVQVQQPHNAAQMQIEPEIGEGQIMQDGLTYYNGLYGEVEAGEQFSIQFRYQKPDDTLSQRFDPVFAAEPVLTQTHITNVWPWILGGLGLLLVLGVVIWYLAPRRISRIPRKRHTSRPPKSEAESDGVFCHNCGTRSHANDIFCRVCGTKLRQ